MKRTILFLTLALILCAALVVGVNATDSTEYTLDSANSIFDFRGYSSTFVDENGTAHITSGYIVNADAEQMFKDMFGEGCNFKYGVFGAFVKRDENGTLLSPLTVDATGSVVANYENNIPVKFYVFNTSYKDKNGTDVYMSQINAKLENIINGENDYRTKEVCLGIYVTDGTIVKYITSEGLSDTPEVICFADFAQGFEAIHENVNKNSGESIALTELFKTIKDDVTFDNLVVKATLGGEPKDISLIGNKLTFIDAGEWEITIYDKDLYCAPVSATVTVNPCDKLAVKFPNTDKYLYRVGNGNAISIGSLFGVVEDFTIADFGIAVDSNNVTYTYTPNSNDWAKGTIKFEGAGVVTVAASCKGGKDAVLKLEVVDAVNATTSAQITSSIAESDVVLLNDVSGGFTLTSGHTLYGNGFKTLCYGDGSYRSASVSYAYITVEGGATLDNIQVYCDIFPKSYMYTSEMVADNDGRYPYGYSAVIVTSGTVSNSYIYGARNNILVNGNATIENTVLECGSLANIQIKGSNANTVILNNVTTIQYQTTSKYDTSKKVLGFGVIVGEPDSESNPTIKLLGDLKQYNWVTSNDTSVSNTYAQTAIKEALKVTAYQHKINGATAVNIGIAFLNGKNVTIDDQRENKNSVPYALNDISMLTYTGQVYSITNSGINGQERCDATADGVLPYQPAKNGIVRPNILYADVNNAIEVKFDYDNSIYSIRIDLDNISGGSYTLSFNNISIIKGSQGLKFSIKDESGNAIDSSASITFNQLATNTYTLEITDNQIYNKDGELTSEVAVYSYPLVISATKTSIEPPKFTNENTATGIRLVEKKGGDWRPAYTVLTGVTVTYWSASESKVKTVDLSTLYNSGTISSNVWTYTCDDFTLTITGGQVHSDGSKITPVVCNNTLYFASTSKAFTTGTSSRSIILTYVFTDKNDSTTFNRNETVTYNAVSEYDYSSFKNGTLAEPSSGSGSCVTPDTLVTLANGTQVRVDSLTGDEMLLVWNMEKGILDFAPIMFVDSESLAEYDVVTLTFSDGTSVDVIYEHGFWDYDLNRYVYLDENASEYIGHYFAKQNGDTLEKVQLVDVKIETMLTTAWSPVTAGHLCYFVNGMLSMPGGVGGLFNIFEVNPDTMTYDYASIEKDIEKYGLFTYEELNSIAPLSKEMFELCGGVYLKISIGKGNMTLDDLIYMINRYSIYY